MSVTEGGVNFPESNENGKPKLGGIMDPRQVHLPLKCSRIKCSIRVLSIDFQDVKHVLEI